MVLTKKFPPGAFCPTAMPNGQIAANTIRSVNREARCRRDAAPPRSGRCNSPNHWNFCWAAATAKPTVFRILPGLSSVVCRPDGHASRQFVTICTIACASATLTRARRERLGWASGRDRRLQRICPPIDCLVPLHEHPGTARAISATSGCLRFPTRWISARGSRSFWRAAGTRLTPGIISQELAGS